MKKKFLIPIIIGAVILTCGVLFVPVPKSANAGCDSRVKFYCSQPHRLYCNRMGRNRGKIVKLNCLTYLVRQFFVL